MQRHPATRAVQSDKVDHHYNSNKRQYRSQIVEDRPSTLWAGDCHGGLPRHSRKLTYLSLLYLSRGADFALLIGPLAAQYAEPASAIFRTGEPKREARYASSLDPVELPANMDVAIELFQLAEAAGRRQDSATAVYLH